MRRYHSGKITELKPNQVFVFGSNLQGFHGAGAAGFAWGVSSKGWRYDLNFQEALHTLSLQAPQRIGKWAILGQGRGFQEGREGYSYAIVTVTRPGKRRSILLGVIYRQLVELSDYARIHPELEFLCCVQGGGLNGYTKEEIAALYHKLERENEVPDNLVFPPDARC